MADNDLKIKSQTVGDPAALQYGREGIRGQIGRLATIQTPRPPLAKLILQSILKAARR